MNNDITTNNSALNGCPGPKGWVCPNCGRGCAPFTAYCPCVQAPQLSPYYPSYPPYYPWQPYPTTPSPYSGWPYTTGGAQSYGALGSTFASLTSGSESCCGHASDCAVHNAPAYPPGPCDCGFSVEG